jgi:flagellar hook-associated protein 2
VVTAKAQAIRKDGFASKTTSVVGDGLAFSAGTFTLRGVSFTLANGDTLQSINNKINASSQASGIISSIVQIDSSNFSLVLKATSTGIENDITEFTDSGHSDNSGSIKIGGSAVTFAEQQNANDASFNLDGLTISRATNTIDDAIKGVTFTLLSNTPSDTPPKLTAKISTDNSMITMAVSNFLTSYNNLLYFNAQQTQRDKNGNFVDTAVLGNDDTLSTVINNIQSTMSNVVSGLSASSAHSLADIGVSAITDPGDGATQPATFGILTLDQSTFSSALSSNFQAFRSVFASNLTSSSPDVSLYKTSNQSTLTSYKLDIDTTRAGGNKVRVLDSSGNFLFNANYENGLITGQAGTSLAGVELLYTGSKAQTVSITSTSGVADQCYNSATNYLTRSTGLLATSIAEIVERDTQLQKNIDADNANIEAQRAILVTQFTNLERVISQANSTLSFLDAQTAANNKN